MQGVYKMRLATFYWEMNKSYNEQVAGVDLLAKTLQKTTRSCRSYRACSDLKKNQMQRFSYEKKAAKLPGRKATLTATFLVTEL